MEAIDKYSTIVLITSTIYFLIMLAIGGLWK